MSGPTRILYTYRGCKMLVMWNCMGPPCLAWDWCGDDDVVEEPCFT
jgi:hypothetical protein